MYFCFCVAGCWNAIELFLPARLTVRTGVAHVNCLNIVLLLNNLYSNKLFFAFVGVFTNKVSTALLYIV